MRAPIACALLLAACGDPKPDDFGPRFYAGTEKVLCAKGVDRDHAWKREQLIASLTTARVQAKTLVTFGHAKGQWNAGIDLDDLAPAFQYAVDHNIPFVTMAELAHGYRGAGWAFTIDDSEVDIWKTWLPTLKKYDIRATFFVTQFDQMTDAQKAALHDLRAAGHDIEAHGKHHLDARQTAAKTGADAYVRDEIAPNLAELRAAGYAPETFSYPYGAHSAALDRAALTITTLVRTTGASHCTDETRN